MVSYEKKKKEVCGILDKQIPILQIACTSELLHPLRVRSAVSKNPKSPCDICGDTARIML